MSMAFNKPKGYNFLILQITLILKKYGNHKQVHKAAIISSSTGSHYQHVGVFPLNFFL